VEPLDVRIVFDTASAALLAAIGAGAMPDDVVATARGRGAGADRTPATN
jgi:hypothetical protein